MEVVAWEGAVSLPDVGNEHRDSPMLEQAPTAFWSEEPWAISGVVVKFLEGAVSLPSVGNVHRDFQCWSKLLQHLGVENLGLNLEV